MSDPSAAVDEPAAALLQLYDDALPSVYGYLISRCGQPALAQDLASETFMAAVDTVRRRGDAGMNALRLVGVARHKLIDHWRRRAREERGLETVFGGISALEDPWEAQLDVLRARDVLEELAPHHRAALTLRYLDDLAVPEVAAVLGRSVHATEALLVRARTAFRRAYVDEESCGG